MKKWPLAAAAVLTLGWLAHRLSSPALPDPGPLPASVPVPDAEPPDGMELIAVPTGVNNRVAAYAYRGGSVFDRRDFSIGAAPRSVSAPTIPATPGGTERTARATPRKPRSRTSARH